jgi:transcriptional regulator with XRE-family HTH domain
MLRAARVLLGLDQEALAKLAGVDRRTIIRIEAGLTPAGGPRRLATFSRIKGALEREGIIFVYPASGAGEGVIIATAPRRMPKDQRGKIDR